MIIGNKCDLEMSRIISTERGELVSRNKNVVNKLDDLISIGLETNFYMYVSLKCTSLLLHSGFSLSSMYCVYVNSFSLQRVMVQGSWRLVLSQDLMLRGYVHVHLI